MVGGTKSFHRGILKASPGCNEQSNGNSKIKPSHEEKNQNPSRVEVSLDNADTVIEGAPSKLGRVFRDALTVKAGKFRPFLVPPVNRISGRKYSNAPGFRHASIHPYFHWHIIFSRLPFRNFHPLHLGRFQPQNNCAHSASLVAF